MVDAIEQLEGSVDEGRAPWCEQIQSELVGFVNEMDRDRLSVESIYRTDPHQFEHTRVHYETVADYPSFDSVFNVSGHN